MNSATLIVLVLFYSCQKNTENSRLNFYDIKTSIAKKIILINNLSSLSPTELNILKSEKSTNAEKDLIVIEIGFKNFQSFEYEYKSIQSSINRHLIINPKLIQQEYFLNEYGKFIQDVVGSKDYYRIKKPIPSPFLNGTDGNLTTTLNLAANISGCCPCTDAYNREMKKLFWEVTFLGVSTTLGGIAAIASSMGLATGGAGVALLTIVGYYEHQKSELLKCWNTCVSYDYQNCW